MSTFLDVGYVTPPGQDVFPTTGPHLDVRVKKDGQYIDPGTIRSLLTRLKVGKEKKPLWQQQGEEWKPSYQITSGFGKRAAPTKGASTYHLGQDYGIAGGTPLFWEGPGKFTPGKGLGTITTMDPEGRAYEIKLLHTKGGKPVEGGGQVAPQPSPQQIATKTGDTYIFVGGKGKQEGSGDFLSSYIQDMLSSGAPQIRSGFDPTSMLAQAFNQTPNYLA